MRLFVATVLSAVFILPAMAKPVTLIEAAAQMRDRGATSIDGALILGEPFIRSELEGQGVTLKLTQCTGEPKACAVTTFATCRQTLDLAKDDGLDIVNTYNTEDDTRGTAYVEHDAALGYKLCVRLRSKLHDEDRFDMADVFDWQLTMRDFIDFTENELYDIEGRQLLGMTRSGASK